MIAPRAPHPGAKPTLLPAMPPLAFTLALAAAFLHAFWNLLLARARDPESATAVALLAAVIVFAPVTVDHVRRGVGCLAVHRRHVACCSSSTSRCSRPRTGRRSCRSSTRSRAASRRCSCSSSRSPCSATTPPPPRWRASLLVGVGVLLVRGLQRPPDPHALWFALGIASRDRRPTRCSTSEGSRMRARSRTSS